MAAYEISLRARISPVAFLLTLRMMPNEPWPIFSNTSNSAEGSSGAALPVRLIFEAMMGKLSVFLWGVVVVRSRRGYPSLVSVSSGVLGAVLKGVL
jgi:hypothetical protein